MRESIEQLLNADNMFLSHTLVRLLLAAFLVNLDTTLVNVALPALVGQPHFRV